MRRKRGTRRSTLWPSLEGRWGTLLSFSLDDRQGMTVSLQCWVLPARGGQVVSFWNSQLKTKSRKTLCSEVKLVGNSWWVLTKEKTISDTVKTPLCLWRGDLTLYSKHLLDGDVIKIIRYTYCIYLHTDFTCFILQSHNILQRQQTIHAKMMISVLSIWSKPSKMLSYPNWYYWLFMKNVTYIHLWALWLLQSCQNKKE